MIQVVSAYGIGHGTYLLHDYFGVWIGRLMLKDPDALASTENHPSWTHMYLMMLTAQVGFAVAYLI